MALLDDDWGFDRINDGEEEHGSGCFGFPENQAAGCFYGQWESDHLLPNSSTSGSTPGSADVSAARELDQESMAVIDPDSTGVVSRRRRRAKGKKTQDDIESQRMTHIAVERNRRKQMNEYLSVIRSLMPESYSQRGDQASIVGGAINFVKELELQLESLEICPREETDQHQIAHWSIAMDESGAGASRSSAAGVEVNLVDCHANIKIRSTKRPKQLLQLVKGLQSIGLTVLHLNANTVQGSALYSLSVKVEDECRLTSGDEITAAVYQILGCI